MLVLLVADIGLHDCCVTLEFGELISGPSLVLNIVGVNLRQVFQTLLDFGYLIA